MTSQDSVKSFHLFFSLSLLVRFDKFSNACLRLENLMCFFCLLPSQISLKVSDRFFSVQLCVTLGEKVKKIPE